MMTKKTHRLHISRIISVGAVEKGDNPKSQIMFWKAKADPEPSPLTTARRVLRALARNIQQRMPGISAADAMVEARRARPDLAEVVAAQALDRQADRVAEVEVTAKEALELIAKERQEVMEPMSQTKPAAAGVRAEVTALAEAMVAADEADTIREARAKVWHERPDLVAKSRQEPTTTSSSASAEVTLGGEITEVVHKRALELSATPGMWNERIPDLRVRVWKSPDGRLLRALLQDSQKRKPATIKKSGEHREAFAVLKSWADDPKVGLR